ncbi:MAG: hypothetical protein QNJ91_03215 [Gammaproteobacteria bacterium]|nr:hypothetical protein [Gammaproteobacteria bacterium]
MLYQAAKSELQSPPSSVPLIAMSIEASALIGAALALLWLL